nr:endonuclease V [Methanohalophilus mahii]
MGRKVVTIDGFENIKLIGGADCTYFKNLVICCIVVLKYPTMEFVERTFHIGKISFPYIPGYFSFREGEGTIRAYQKLSNKPDLLMINACGVTHPANAGFASHIGVVLDKPTIGITKRMFCGRAKIPQKENEAQPLYDGGKQRGWLLKVLSETKPIVITVGHRTSIKSCLEITIKCLKGSKMPEPLRLAHRCAGEEKKKWGKSSGT